MFEFCLSLTKGCWPVGYCHSLSLVLPWTVCNSIPSIYIHTHIYIYKNFCQSLFSCETKDHIHWVLDSLCQWLTPCLVWLLSFCGDGYVRVTFRPACHSVWKRARSISILTMVNVPWLVTFSSSFFFIPRGGGGGGGTTNAEIHLPPPSNENPELLKVLSFK